MSIIVIDNQRVHYEVFGRGRPVVFLHGWLGSWRYWYTSMEVVSRHFRTYSFDFWGFGESRTNEMPTIQGYSNQVIRFLDAMGIERAALVGHSMGGMVAMKTAIEHPERVTRVATVGAPINGDSLSWMLKLVDRPFFAEFFARRPWLRRSLFRFFFGDSLDPEVDEVLEDSTKSTADTIRAAIHSMWRTDLTPMLDKLRVPALVVHGARDDIVNPNQLQLFTYVTMAQVVRMEQSRHFPFVDEADRFHEILLGFLKQPDLIMSSSKADTKPSPTIVPPPTEPPAPPASEHASPINGNEPALPPRPAPRSPVPPRMQ
ncbi:alpha/beta hydrolase [Chloroflexus sp.]|uniref:alpha/beta fold hydrolase n=1 Tax=Chloroflexus sp. TaxID=1904827 RepID=UPI00298EE1C9|nr:alpha/beta hydrolase [Chloroflexus sp.]MDW8403590.1 alpha/beta hydrolase [Chloroflexus sp.]